MSNQKLKLVEYSESSSEEDNGDDEKHMADNQGKEYQSDSEVQKIQCDSVVHKVQYGSEVQKVHFDGSGRKVAVVEPRIIQENMDHSYGSNSPGEFDPPSSPLPIAPPPSPDNFLVSGSLTILIWKKWHTFCWIYLFLKSGPTIQKTREWHRKLRTLLLKSIVPHFLSQ